MVLVSDEYRESLSLLYAAYQSRRDKVSVLWADAEQSGKFQRRGRASAFPGAISVADPATNPDGFIYAALGGVATPCHGRLGRGCF